MFPHEKGAAVSRALREAFGTTAIEDIRAMPNGLSSDLVFRIVVHGSPFLLKIMTRIDERNDPTRLFTAMKAAAKAGLAPVSGTPTWKTGFRSQTLWTSGTPQNRPVGVTSKPAS